MTKMDGDARGGAALSIRHMTGVPLKFITTGEKPDDIEIFYPDRMAERILGMGDILQLIEKAQENLDEKKLQKSMNRLMAGKFDLEDMLTQMEQMNKMGPLKMILKLIPGMPKLTDEQKQEAEDKLKVTRAIIYSMTVKERRNPEIIKASRKARIAKGCGKDVSDVNRLLRQFEQMSAQMMQLGKMMKSGRMPNIRR
jgi:signal recognition particle subunit SRP54